MIYVFTTCMIPYSMLTTVAMIPITMLTVIMIPALMPSIVVITIPAGMIFMPITLAIVGGIYTAIPTVSDKIDRTIASMITAAIITPVTLISDRNTQINGFDIGRSTLNPDRLRINQLRRWCISHRDLTIETRLADINRDTDTRMCGYWAEDS